MIKELLLSEQGLALLAWLAATVVGIIKGNQTIQAWYAARRNAITDRALGILTASVGKTYSDLVVELKKKSADGQLTADEIKQVQAYCIADATANCKEAGIDIAKSLGNADSLKVIIGGVVKGLKRGDTLSAEAISVLP